MKASDFEKIILTLQAIRAGLQDEYNRTDDWQYIKAEVSIGEAVSILSKINLS